MSEYYSTDPHDPREGGGESQNQDHLEAAREALNSALRTAREKSSAACEEAEAFIRRSPLEAVGYAAGIGAVIGLVAGLLMHRRD
jgi:ElaB/YqjD/DUF883 family membrane-anchored ribosome-binding protein